MDAIGINNFLNFNISTDALMKSISLSVGRNNLSQTKDLNQSVMQYLCYIIATGTYSSYYSTINWFCVAETNNTYTIMTLANSSNYTQLILTSTNATLTSSVSSFSAIVTLIPLL